MTDTATASTDSATVTRLGAALGAEITGIDLAGADEPMASWITERLLEHKVLFFPGQDLSTDDHVALGRLFGPLEGHPNLANAFLDHPEIFELAASNGGIADEWHTDLTFQEQPSVMSILKMVTCPEVGGDTMWASTAAAYEALSDPMRDLCDGLTALHDAWTHKHPEKMMVHPVVRTHPVTGERCLYVSEHFTRRIVEMSHRESEMLLGFLTDHVRSERFTIRYRWTPGTIAMWDNRCTQHYVLNDFDGERIIQRVTIVGDVVEGEPARWAPALHRRSAQSNYDRQLREWLARQGEGNER